MARRRQVQAGLLILALAGTLLAYRWWTSPERQIRRILTVVASAVNHDRPDAGLEALASVAALQRHLAVDVAVELGRGSRVISGRQEIVSQAARLRVATPMLLVQFFDEVITVEGASSANVRVTAQVTSRNQSGEDVVEVLYVDATVEAHDGEWVVTSARLRSNDEDGA
jgi:hypothetical protein